MDVKALTEQLAKLKSCVSQIEALIGGGGTEETEEFDGGDETEVEAESEEGGMDPKKKAIAAMLKKKIGA